MLRLLAELAVALRTLAGFGDVAVVLDGLVGRFPSLPAEALLHAEEAALAEIRGALEREARD